MSQVSHTILVFLAAVSLQAATLQQLSIDQMTGKSTAVVRARVAGSSASFTGSTIYTHYKLQVSEVWKGSAASATDVVTPGGDAAGIRQTYPGVSQLENGREYVLFLWTSPSGMTHLVGLTQGMLVVNPQADGSAVASRPESGEVMLDAAGKRVADKAVNMKVAELKAIVRAGTKQ